MDGKIMTRLQTPEDENGMRQDIDVITSSDAVITNQSVSNADETVTLSERLDYLEKRTIVLQDDKPNEICIWGDTDYKFPENISDMVIDDMKRLHGVLPPFPRTLIYDKTKMTIQEAVDMVVNSRTLTTLRFPAGKYEQDSMITVDGPIIIEGSMSGYNIDMLKNVDVNYDNFTMFYPLNFVCRGTGNIIIDGVCFGSDSMIGLSGPAKSLSIKNSIVYSKDLITTSDIKIDGAEQYFYNVNGLWCLFTNKRYGNNVIPLTSVMEKQPYLYNVEISNCRINEAIDISFINSNIHDNFIKLRDDDEYIFYIKGEMNPTNEINQYFDTIIENNVDNTPYSHNWLDYTCYIPTEATQNYEYLYHITISDIPNDDENGLLNNTADSPFYIHAGDVGTDGNTRMYFATAKLSIIRVPSWHTDNGKAKIDDIFEGNQNSIRISVIDHGPIIDYKHPDGTNMISIGCLPLMVYTVNEDTIIIKLTEDTVTYMNMSENIMFKSEINTAMIGLSKYFGLNHKEYIEADSSYILSNI